MHYRIDGDLELPDAGEQPLDNGGHFSERELSMAVAAGFNAYAKGEDASHPSFKGREEMQHALIELEAAGQSVRIRYSSTPREGGFKAALRLLRDEVKRNSFVDLGFSETQNKQLHTALRVKGGLFLVAGPTGAGKSRTIKAALENIPNLAKEAVYTIEDPVEYVVPGVDPIPIRREVTSRGAAEDPFAAARRQIVRMDPDTISIGEIRDPETGQTARAMVDSGHRVFGTVHERSLMGIFDRLAGPEIRMDRHSLTRSEFINLLVAQRLVPLLCNHCKVPALEAAVRSEVLRSKLLQLRELFGLDLTRVYTARRTLGTTNQCKHCGGRGVYGRTAIAEVLEPDAQLLQLVRHGRDYEASELYRSRRRARFDEPDTLGKTIFEHGIYKVSCGLIDLLHLEQEIHDLSRYEPAQPPQRQATPLAERARTDVVELVKAAAAKTGTED